jgi:hypothetical protein
MPTALRQSKANVKSADAFILWTAGIQFRECDARAVCSVGQARNRFADKNGIGRDSCSVTKAIAPYPYQFTLLRYQLLLWRAGWSWKLCAI